jgi:hypothetical protein
MLPALSVDLMRKHSKSLLSVYNFQILEEALEASGNDLETAIRNLNKLRLESSVADLSSSKQLYENGTSCAEGTINSLIISYLS